MRGVQADRYRDSPGANRGQIIYLARYSFHAASQQIMRHRAACAPQKMVASGIVRKRRTIIQASVSQRCYMRN